MKGRTLTFGYIFIMITWIFSESVLCQDHGSGDDLRFEDDEDFSISSGELPSKEPILPPVSPLGGGGIKPPMSRDHEEGSGFGDIEDIWGRREASYPSPPLIITSRIEKISSTVKTPSTARRPTWSPNDDDESGDDDYETSGDIPLEPKKEEVPRVGGEVIIVDPFTTNQSTVKTRSTMFTTRSTAPTTRSTAPTTKSTTLTTKSTTPTTRLSTSLVDHSSPAVPHIRQSSTLTTTITPTTTSSTTQAIKTVWPDGDLNTSPETETIPSFWARLRFFKVFSDPLILAGIIGGAVLALLCIVLVVMFMIYRVRKKDEGSYALGEPRRAYDIKYTRTNDQEYFA